MGPQDVLRGNTLIKRQRVRIQDATTAAAKPGEVTTLKQVEVCYNYYLVGYDVNSGTQVFSDFIGRSCTSVDDGSGNGGGGESSGGNSGGGGNSGPSPGDDPNAPSPNMVLVIPPTTPVTNVREFLKCFTTNQAATLTLYVNQPVPGTTATYNGTDVGHAFLSLSQNGITRVFGFYPASPNAPIHAVSSVFGDDSQHGYDVSITTTISPASLSKLLNYTYGYTANQYSLQHNNCVNFSIGACAQFGLTLPNTQGVWLGLFRGSNPGDLGEDIRDMTLPSGVTRDVTGGTAPSNSGGC